MRTNWRLLIIYWSLKWYWAFSYLGKLSREHGNIFVNLKTARNKKGSTFILKVSFFLMNMHYKSTFCINSYWYLNSFAHSFVRSFKHSIICPSVLHSFLPFFLPSFIQPPTNYPKNLLLTDQHTLTVSYVTYQLSANFLSSLRNLIEDTLYNIPHPSSYILVE